MEPSWYSRLLAHHPWIFLAVVFILSTACVILPLITEQFPDFSDPQVGFEARGTSLAQRLVTWKNLLESSGPRGILADNPLEYYYFLQDEKLNKIRYGYEKKERHKKKRKHHKNSHLINKKAELSNNINPDAVKTEFSSTKSSANFTAEFFCNKPNPDYARVVVSSKNSEQNLWTLDGIVAQCKIDSALRSSPHFSSLCENQQYSNKKCCLSWSVPNYIALLANKTTCSQVTQEDLLYVEELLQKCIFFYRKHDLTSDCSENLSCQLRVPTKCHKHDAVYHLLHFLLDIEFFSRNNNSINAKLQSAIIFLPIAASSAALNYYTALNTTKLTYKHIKVTAMEFGLKSTLFDRLLVSDSFLLIFGFTFVTICIWFYTESIFITISTIFVVIFSIGISYTLYSLVFRIKLFPFMNLLTLVVAVGICSDDTFIFCKIWECNKRTKSLNAKTNLTRLVHKTMSQAVPSMFVTSLTTTVAFLASIVSNVTAINCFSLFSGMTVIVNFFLMITWLPASVILSERFRSNAPTSGTNVFRNLLTCVRIGTNDITNILTKFLIRTIVSLRWMWFLIFFTFGLGSCYVVFRYPGFQLPDSPDFQLFDSLHPFEQYDLLYTKRYWFEKDEHNDGGDVLPVRFVWGVLPIDNGDYLNPQALGTLVFDNTFDIASRESQVWLHNFCKDLRIQPFYRSTLGPLLPNCFIESLQPWMERNCEDPVDPSINNWPCCREAAFPYEPAVLKECAAKIVAEIHRTPTHLWKFRGSGGTQTSGLKFRKQNDTVLERIVDGNSSSQSLKDAIPEIQVVVVEYDSTFEYSLSFAEMNQFYTRVESWMQKQLATAPRGMKNGWFVSYLDFYELQRTLFEGTIWAMVVSMGLALSVLAIVTMNPFVSLYAILAVGGSIVVTVGALILMGWKLNVLESVAVSTAIGLAVDFSLHYSVSYRASWRDNRVDRVKEALEQMGGPTLMAGLTTAAAGALMIPSRVLAYIQIGVFLILIMGVSWMYATFLLCPLLSIAGPASRLGSIKNSWFKKTSAFWTEKSNSEGVNEMPRAINRSRRESIKIVPNPSRGNDVMVYQFRYESASPSATLLEAQAVRVTSC